MPLEVRPLPAFTADSTGTTQVATPGGILSSTHTIPLLLGTMSSPFVIDEPVELPDGTLRCKTHHLEVCGICCVDYSYMRDILQEDEALEAKEPATQGSKRRHKPVCAVCMKAAGKKCSKCKMIRYCSVEHQKMDWNNHKRQCTSSGIVQPTLLFLNTGDMRDWVDETFDDFFIVISSSVRVSRAVDTRTAMETLASSTCPSYVIIGDRVEPRAALINDLVQHVRNGGTVAFGMGFPRFTKPAEINEIFSQFGLSWKAGVRKRARFVLNHDEPMINDKRAKKELLNRSVNPLPNPLSMEALLLSEVPSDQAIYFEVQHGGYNLTRGNIETPVAFAPVGQGWVGYIGDIRWEGVQGFTEVVMEAMIGIRIYPMPKFRADELPMFSQFG